MLDQMVNLLDGTQVLASGGVLDIGRRLNEGDPTVGWPGDPSMVLVADVEEFITDPDGRPIFPRTRNPYFGWFEVWGVDAHQQTYLVTRSPTCDVDLLRRLAENHWSHADRHDQIVTETRRRAKAKADAGRDARMEQHEKLHAALMRDIGAYEGGLTRRLH